MFRFRLSILLALVAASICAAQSSDQLLPASTKGFVSIPNVRDFQEQWKNTQLGKLANDPVMKPFADDLRRQVRDRLIRSNLNVSLDWDDIHAISSGEFCLAVVETENGEKSGAVLILDVSGHIENAQKMLSRIGQELEKRGAKRSAFVENGQQLIVHELPREKGQLAPDRVYRFLVNDRLVIANEMEVSRQLLARLVNKDFSNSFRDSEMFKSTIARCSDGISPHINWYADPFGLAKVIRDASSTKRRSKDTLGILQSQGFDAIRGLGGVVQMMTQEHEVLHRTYVFAPSAEGAEPGQRFKLAARMLDFPNSEKWDVAPWVPKDVASYTSTRWKTKEAFEYSKTLVDAIAGDPGFLDDVIESIKSDPNGPKIDLRNEFIKHLRDRITVITDQVVPVTTSSERLLVAVEVDQYKQVANTVHKAFHNDPTAHKHTIKGHAVWEIVAESDDEDLTSPDAILDPSFDESSDEDKRDDEGRLLTNYAITVIEDHLLFSTHVEQIREILELPKEKLLSNCEDYQLVQQHLAAIGAGNDSLRRFSRTDEEFRTNYEMIRQNKMPESESMLGRFLNRFLGEPNKDLVREQKLDGSHLPEYQAVRRYFGPAAAFSRSTDDGWFISGFLINKHQSFLGDEDKAAVTSRDQDKGVEHR